MAEIVEKRMIRWDGAWGVALRYSNGKRVTYPVGSRDEAERELMHPRPPDPNPEPATDDVASRAVVD